MELSADFIRRFNNPFSALRHRNFRYYWGGMCISLIGTWMQNIALPWLAYSMTGSPFLLSLVSALQFTPMLLFSLFAGVIVDRFHKKNILYFTQSAALLITLTLAVLVWSGHVRYWHLLVLATMLGMVNTLDMPTRHSFIIELVGREELMNAIALNSSIFNMARVIGPALAGIVMATMGIAFCFYINSLSFAAVLTGLFFIHPLVENQREFGKGEIWENIKDGLRYIADNEHLSSIIMTVAIIGVFAMNFNVLVPVFTKEVLGQDETVFAFLMSLVGLGSFVGAMLIATMSRSGPQKFVLNVVPFFIAALLILTGLTNKCMITGLCLAASGLFFVAFTSSANSSLQLNSTDGYRGRVISVYLLVFGGGIPLGNIYSGFISDHLGSRAGFIACGGAILALLGLRRFIKMQ
ncbi:MAG: MFS transporter [Deltaproteobacteria bacterium]|nr:MFS transporter [Deltaproteobacteria bacterium]